MGQKKTTVRKVESQHPPTSGQRAGLKRHSGQQCIGLTCQESCCVENAVERKFRRAKEAREVEKKGPFDKCKCFSETLRIKIKPPCSIRFLKWPLRKSVCRGLYEVTRTVPYVEHALLCPPSCCLPRFLITLLFSQNGTYHTPAHIVSHCFTSHYLNSMSAASPGEDFSVLSHSLTSSS